MKKAHQMTLNEYREIVVPKIVELKKIIRMKYMKPVDFYGLKHMKYDDYLKHVRDNYNTQFSLPTTTIDDLAEQSAIERWRAGKLKFDEMPIEAYERYEELFAELSPLFINHTVADLSKLHKDNRTEIRRAIDKDIYIKDIQNDDMDFAQLEEVCSSNGVRIPKRIYDLKAKVEAGFYKREFVKANKEFIKLIRSEMIPYVDALKKTKISHLEQAYEEFEAKSTTIRDFLNSKKSTPIHYELHKLYLDDGSPRENFESLRTQLCEDYAESFVIKFIGRFEDKLNIVNVKWGMPKIKFLNDATFKGGEWNGAFELTYDNGEVIQGNCAVVIAGGYIQSLHQRYYFHFWHNEKMVTLEQMDELGA